MASGCSIFRFGGTDVLVENCTVVGGNGFRYCYTKGTVTFKDSTITGSVYGIHFDGSAGGNIVIDNCVITGWTSFASTINKVTISDDLTSADAVVVNVYIYYEGEDPNCMSANAVNIQTLGISIDFAAEEYN